RYDGVGKNNGVTADSNTIPLRLDSYSRFYNVVGNVLGSTARPHITYEAGGNQSVYQIGLGTGVPDDPNTKRTLLRWGNYDVVNGGNRFSTAEVPSGIALYANA